MQNEKSANGTVQGRIIRLKMADGTMINGQVNIQRHPGYDRLSDLIIDPNFSFLILFDATIYDASTKDPARRETLFVNKTQILWAEPEEGQK